MSIPTLREYMVDVGDGWSLLSYYPYTLTYLGVPVINPIGHTCPDGSLVFVVDVDCCRCGARVPDAIKLMRECME